MTKICKHLQKSAKSAFEKTVQKSVTSFKMASERIFLGFYAIFKWSVSSEEVKICGFEDSKATLAKISVIWGSNQCETP